jgi:hypothetical protein
MTRKFACQLRIWLTDLNWLMIISFHPCVTYIYYIYDRHCKRAAKDPTKYDETMCKLGNPKKQKRVRYCHPSCSPSSLIPWSSPLTLYIHIYKYTYIHVSTLCCKGNCPLSLSLLVRWGLWTMSWFLSFIFWTWLMVKKCALGYNNFHHVRTRRL